MNWDRLFCVFVAVHLTGILTASAQTTNRWTLGGDGKWETAGNWSAGTPTNSNAANLITNATTKSVTIDAGTPAANLTISNLFISGPSGTTNTLQLTNAPALTLVVLSNLTINSGGAILVTNSTLQADGKVNVSPVILDGTVTLDSGNILTTNLDVRVGTGSGSNGTINVNGGLWDASRIFLGDAGGAVGTLTCRGGEIRSRRFGGISLGTISSTGAVWVVGSQARLVLTNTFLTIGSLGSGQLTVSNGTMLASNITVGAQASSRGTFTIAGGSVTNDASFTVGDFANATGTVWMTDGTLVSQVTVGSSGVGQMILSNGTVHASGFTVNPQGTFTMAGGTNLLEGPLAGVSVGGSAWIVGNSARMVATNQPVSVGGQLIISNGNALVGIFNVNGGVAPRGNFTMAGGVVTSSFLSISSSAGNTGTVWVTGGQIDISSSVFIVPTGRLTMSNGVMTAGNIEVGNGTFVVGDGALTMAGGTNTVGSSLTVGKDGSRGTLWVVDSAARLVATNTTTFIGSNGNSSAHAVGVVTVSNGTWLARDIRIGAGLFTAATGTVSVVGGTVAAMGPVTLGDFAIVTNVGSLFVTGGQLVITNTPAAVGAGSGLIVDGFATVKTGSSLVVSNVNTVIGNRGSGSLTVSGGSMSLTNLVVGNLGGASGTLTIAGGTTTLSGFGRLGVGATTTGTVWMTGGELIVTNSQTDFSIGEVGAGQMTISNGTFRGLTLLMGNDPGSSGTLTIAGGTNILNRSITVASDTGGAGAVWLTAGELTVTNNFTSIVGSAGAGKMTISNGTFRANDLLLGSSAGSGGTLTMVGGGAVCRSLTLGSFDCAVTGTVIVAGGSLFVTNAGFSLEVRSGTVQLNSGTLVVDRLVLTNSCGHFVHAGGTLTQNKPPILGAGMDADGDGLPNDWEVAYGLDPLDGTGFNGPNGDPDGDGMNNLQEFLAGSNPVIDIKSITKETNDIRVTWQTLAGKTNALQRTAGDVNGGFATNNFADILIINNNIGSVTNYLDVGTATNFPASYYRVRLVP
jgi:hypothetical protein